MKKQLRITVSGQSFDVTVETLTAPKPTAAGPVVVAPVPAAAPAPVAAPAPTAAAGTGTPVLSPLAGKVVSLSAQPGTAVKKDQTIIVLEAMKMNTDIPAPVDGTIASFAVQPGDTVAEGQVLAYLG